ncbi:MAG: IS110 family transposase [Treponema sp.]|jgi:transposase|nr:IS110 family transposase [Treponema sp.]
MKKVYYIGLDVHKDNTQMAVLEMKGKEPVVIKVIDSDPLKVAKEILPYHREGTVHAGYEAGCMGYTLYRVLTEMKIDCQIIAPNKVFRGGNNEKIKTDKRDATAIAWMLRRDEGAGIAVPDREDEAARDLLRCRGDMQDDLKRAKQRLLKFLLRHGHIYENTRYWTGKHRKWMKTLVFDMPVDKAVFEQYQYTIESIQERVGRVDLQIKEIAESQRYTERVRKFRAFKGVDYIIALSLVCEIGDFKRFPTAAAFMSYLGLVPSEYSSGKKRKQGGITKTGNGHIRKLLTEAAWHYTRPAKVSMRLASRRIGTAESVISYADRALNRLHGKYVKLLFKGKSKQAAVTAVARELSGFLWGVMTAVA